MRMWALYSDACTWLRENKLSEVMDATLNSCDESGRSSPTLSLNPTQRFVQAPVWTAQTNQSHCVGWDQTSAPPAEGGGGAAPLHLCGWWGEGVKVHMLDVDQLAHTEPGNAILSCDSASSVLLAASRTGVCERSLGSFLLFLSTHGRPGVHLEPVPFSPSSSLKRIFAQAEPKTHFCRFIPSVSSQL